MANVFDLRSTFEDQFEPDGDGFLYRRYSKSAPIRVSAVERERFISVFDRFQKYGKWTSVTVTVLLILSIAGYSVLSNTEVSDITIYIGLGVMLVVYMYFHFRTWNFPARELRARETVGQARSKSEIRQRMASSIGYGQIALLFALGIALPAGTIRNYGLQSLWGIAGIAYCLFMTVCCAIILFRKWRIGAGEMP